MKLLLMLFISSLLISNIAISQDKDVMGRTSANASNVFGEFGGNGLLFSANYDFRFLKKEKGLGMRLGIGFFGGSDGGILTLPVAINNLSGKAPNYFEVGLGYTYATTTSTGDFLDGSTSFLIPSLGYRYQPSKKGFTGRIFISPLIGIGGDAGWIMFGGISGGYRF